MSSTFTSKTRQIKLTTSARMRGRVAKIAGIVNIMGAGVGADF
jgi:hypothetical protein